MLATVAGFDSRDRHSIPAARLGAKPARPTRLRLAVSEDLGFAALDDGVRAAFRAAVDRLSDAGVQLIPENPGRGTSAAVWSTIALAEARYSEAKEFAEHRAELTDAAAQFIEAGAEVTAGQYIRAQFAREHIHRAYADMFARTGATALITPTLGCEAFPHGLGYPEAIGGVPITPPDYDWAPFLYDANLAGLPACALPMGLGHDGLPVSMQVLGMRCDDGRVLAAAQVIESVLGFDAHPPDQGGTS
jgi:Asp-tRNA(Asn)/Glu-tRNA(Gln) amidotransferase A subunit family amidase